MKFALLTGDETPEDLRELIGNLRDRQKRCKIQSVKDDLDRDISEALDLIASLWLAGPCRVPLAGDMRSLCGLPLPCPEHSAIEASHAVGQEQA